MAVPSKEHVSACAAHRLFALLLITMALFAIPTQGLFQVLANSSYSNDPMAIGFKLVAAYDANKDGLLDIVSIERGTATRAHVSYDQGGGVYSNTNLGTIPAHGGVEGLDVADLNGDGDPEVILGHPRGDQLKGLVTISTFASVLPSGFKPGTVSIFAEDLGLSPGFGSAVAVAYDIDGNGIVDIAVGSPTDNLVIFLFLDTDLSVKNSARLLAGSSIEGMSANMAYFAHGGMHLLASTAVDIGSGEKVVVLQNFTINTGGSTPMLSAGNPTILFASTVQSASTDASVGVDFTDVSVSWLPGFVRDEDSFPDLVLGCSSCQTPSSDPGVIFGLDLFFDFGFVLAAAVPEYQESNGGSLSGVGIDVDAALSFLSSQLARGQVVASSPNNGDFRVLHVIQPFCLEGHRRDSGECKMCDPETYQDKPYRTTCKPTTTCGIAGQVLPPTPTSDRVCTECTGDSYFVDTGICVNRTKCVDGFVEAVAPTPTTDRECKGDIETCEDGREGGRSDGETCTCSDVLCTSCYFNPGHPYADIDVVAVRRGVPALAPLASCINASSVEACATRTLNIPNSNSFTFDDRGAGECCSHDFEGDVLTATSFESGDPIFFLTRPCLECTDERSAKLVNGECIEYHIPPTLQLFPSVLVMSGSTPVESPVVTVASKPDPVLAAKRPPVSLVTVSVEDDFQSYFIATSNAVFLVNEWDKQGTIRVNITASDSRSECILPTEDGVEHIEGPCTNTTVLTVVTPYFESCAPDVTRTLASGSFVAVDLEEPILVSDVPIAVSSDAPSTQLYPPGTTVVTFQTGALDAGDPISCTTNVTVVPGLTAPVSRVSTSSSPTSVAVFLIDNLFGSELSDLSTFSLLGSDTLFRINVESALGQPFLVLPPDPNLFSTVELRFAFDIRYCPSAVTSFPDDVSESDTITDVDVSFISSNGPAVTLENVVRYVDAMTGCARVAGSSGPIAHSFFFDAVYIDVHAPDGFFSGLFPGGVTHEPRSPSYVAFVLDDSTGRIPPDALMQAPVSLQDMDPPQFDGCPSEPIEVFAEHGEVSTNASWPAVTARDNVQIVSLTSTHEPGDFFSVLDSPHTVTYTASDGTAISTCTFEVQVKVEEELKVELDNFINISRSEQSFEFASRKAVDYNLLRSASDLDFTANVGQRNVLELKLADSTGRVVVVQGTDNTTAVKLLVDITWQTPFLSPITYVLDTDKTRLKAKIARTALLTSSSSPTSGNGRDSSSSTTGDLDLNFSLYSARLMFADAMGEIRIVGEVPISGEMAFDELTLELLFLNDLSSALPSSTASWTTRGGAFIGFSYVYDEAQAVSDDVFAVTFFDASPPQFTSCPSNITVPNDPHKGYATVTWPAVEAIDLQSQASDPFNALYTNNTGVFDVVPPGSEPHVVVYTSSDLFGNTATCEFTVTVLDVQRPNVTCSPRPVIVPLPSAGGQASVSLSTIAGTAVDNVDYDAWLTRLAPLSGSMLSLGRHRFVTVYVDGYGNKNNCTTIVDIVDETAPVSTFCPEELQPSIAGKAATSSAESLLPIVQPSSSDSYFAFSTDVDFTSISFTDNVNIANLTWSVPTTALYPVNAHTPVSVIAFDAAGNNNTCNFTVEVPQLAGGAAASADLSTGTLAGIGSGGGALLLFFVIAIVLLRRSSRKNPQDWDDIFATMEAFRKRKESQAGPVEPREIRRSQLKLNAELGKGAFGIVYKALLNDIPGAPAYLVAVKSLHENATGADRQELLEEAAVMAQFAHPNVVALVGVVTVGDPLFVILEYMENGSLKSYLEKHDCSAEMKIQFIADCASGLAHIHSKGFIHRDVAARNVLISSDTRAKIADFGLTRESKEHEDYYRSRGGALPVRWTAPEALESRKFDESTDIWSMGIVMYEVYTHAETPYKGFTNQKVWVQVCAGYRLPCPEGCPDVVYKHMLQCWSSDASDRPSFHDLEVAFRQLEDTDHAPAVPSRPPIDTIAPDGGSKQAAGSEEPSGYLDMSTAQEVQEFQSNAYVEFQESPAGAMGTSPYLDMTDAQEVQATDQGASHADSTQQDDEGKGDYLVVGGVSRKTTLQSPAVRPPRRIDTAHNEPDAAGPAASDHHYLDPVLQTVQEDAAANVAQGREQPQEEEQQMTGAGQAAPGRTTSNAGSNLYVDALTDLVGSRKNSKAGGGMMVSEF